MSYDSIFDDFLAEKHSDVIKKCNKLIRNLDSSDERARRILLNNRATAYLKMGFARKAIKDSIAASEVDEFWLRPVYTHIQALIKKNQFDQAKTVYKEWLNEQEEGTVDISLQKEVEVFMKSEKQACIDREKAEKKRKADEKAERKRKKAEEKRLAKEKAERERQEKKVAREKHEKAKFAFIDILIKQGIYKKAITEYTLLIKENADLVPAYFGRGQMYFQMGKWDKAVRDLNNAVIRGGRRDAKHLLKLAEARNYRADYMMTKSKRKSEVAEELERAVVEISRAVKILRSTYDIQSIFDSLRLRAHIFRKQGDHEYALHDFQDALKYLPQHIECIIAMGLSLTDLGRPKDAIKVYTEALIYAKDKNVGILQHNIALAYVNLGGAEDAEKHFAKAIKAGNTETYNARSMFRYFCGNVQRTLKDINKAGELADEDNIAELQVRLQMRGVAYHSLGQYRWAEKDYDKLLNTEPEYPGLISWFRHQMLPKTQSLLDKPFTEYNFDQEFDPKLKTGYVHSRNPKVVKKSGYQPNNGKISTSISDVNLTANLTEEQQQIRDDTNRLGYLLQNPSSGFVKNARQHRMFGMAVIEIAQTMKSHWENPIQVTGKGASFNQKPHAFGWRDMMDIAVRWRQQSEPNDQIFWNDLLIDDAQNGQQLSILSGQKKSDKYYEEYYDRCFKLLKPMACEQTKNNTEFDKGLIMEAKTLDDVHKLIGHDFSVNTFINSRCGEEKFEAARFILMEKQPNGHNFTIQWPVKAEKDENFDRELTKVFKEFEELKRDGDELDKAVELSLTFYYYWINYGALCKGNGACGLIALNALLIAAGYLLKAQIPIQIDVEGVLFPTHKKFVEKFRGKMEVIPLSEDRGGASFSEIPKVSDNITNLREMIHVLNLKES